MAKVYKTVAESGQEYSFEYDPDSAHGWVKISIGENEWGASDGNRFIRALLRDIDTLSAALITKLCPQEYE